MALRVQVIPSEQFKFLRDFYDCKLWKIYNVLRVVPKRTHKNCKVQRTWNEYEIEVIHKYPHNYQGQKTIIRVSEPEVKVLE